MRISECAYLVHGQPLRRQLYIRINAYSWTVLRHKWWMIAEKLYFGMCLGCVRVMFVYKKDDPVHTWIVFSPTFLHLFYFLFSFPHHILKHMNYIIRSWVDCSDRITSFRRFYLCHHSFPVPSLPIVDFLFYPFAAVWTASIYMTRW